MRADNTSNNLFKAYLKDISNASVLPIEREIKIAKSLTEKKRLLNRAIFSSYSAIEELIGYAREIRNHKMPIEHLLLLNYPKKRKIYFQKKRYNFLARMTQIEGLLEEWKNTNNANVISEISQKIAKKTTFFNFQPGYMKRIIKNERKRYNNLSLLYKRLTNGKRNVKRGIKAFESKHKTNLKEMEEREKSIETLEKEIMELKNMLIQGNMRLVISVAKNYIGRGVEFDDLIQEGNSALLKAIDRFDYRYGYRFSSYAIWWIKHALNTIVSEQPKALKIPVYVMDMYYKILKEKTHLTQELERPPTLEEISERALLNVKKIEFIYEAVQESVSLDAPIREGENARMGEFIEDVDSTTPAKEFAKKMLRKRLYGLLKELNYKERAVLELRYGLIDGVPRTLEDIGGILNLTKERVRQIQNGAIQKLSKPFRIRTLSPYYEAMK